MREANAQRGPLMEAWEALPGTSGRQEGDGPLPALRGRGMLTLTDWDK